MRVDAEIERIARRKHRIVTLDELRALGLSRDAVAHRVRHGRLQRLWPRTYLVGAQPPDPMTLAMGAVASYNGNGALGDRWGAWLWGFAGPPRLPIDVAVLRGTRADRSRIRARSRRWLDPRDVTTRRGILVLRPAAICLALATSASRLELERLVAQAQVIGVLRESHLHHAVARYRGRPGTVALTAVIAEGASFTRAESERRMLALVREADLPRPETNVPLLRYEVDFLFRDQRVVVEVDGYSTHGTRRAFEHDRRRQQELTAAGYRVVHVTWRQLRDEPMAVAARLAAILAIAAVA